MDLLKASYTGSLGNTTGAKWKNKAVIKAKIWSKAPPTASQTASVRAFECLNRIASAIARAGFKHLPLSAKKMLPHNAVAQWLKPAIKNKLWEPQNISEVIPYSNLIEFEFLIIDKATNKGLVRLKYKSQPQELLGSLLFIAVFRSNAHIADCRIIPMFTEEYTFQLPEPIIGIYSAIGFLSTPIDKTNKISNFIYKENQGMKYSTEEQATGDLWLDGRIIYKKIIETRIQGLEKGKSKTVRLDVDQNIEIINADTMQIRIAGSGGPTFGPIDRPRMYVNNLELFAIAIKHSVQFNQLEISVAVTNEVDVWNGEFAADIRMAISYTKTNEEPLI